MVNPLLSRMLKRHVPPMNPQVMEGLSCSYIKYVEEYLDACLKSIARGLPPMVKYLRIERCTPQEEYEEVTRNRTSGRTIDIARSTLYLTKAFLEYTDASGKVHPFTRYIYLPYVEKGGIFYLSGTPLHFIPTLSDKVLTPNENSIFVRLTMDRSTISRVNHIIKANGNRRMTSVTHATIYRNAAARGKGKEKNSLLANAETCLAHYIIARYGFVEAFRKYTGTVPVVGFEEVEEEVSKSKSEWIVYSSAGTALEQKKHQATTHATRFRLAFKVKDVTPAVEAMVAGVFYVLDHFPHRFRDAGELMNDKDSWMILLGKIIFGELYTETKLHRDILDHLRNLDEVLDEITREKLEESGIQVSSYFDLLNYIQVEFNTLVLQASRTRLSTYGKNYEIMHYAMYDLFSGFTKFGFELNKVYSQRYPTFKDVEENLKSFFRMGAIYGLASGKSFTTTVSYTGDHMYPKITGVATEQETSIRTSTVETIGPQHRLDITMATTGSLLFLPKSSPTPLARTNPWVNLDPRTGTVLPSPKFATLLEQKRKYFKL